MQVWQQDIWWPFCVGGLRRRLLLPPYSTNLIKTAAALSIVFLLGACSPFYVMRAVYEEGGILLRRQKIEKIVNDPGTADEIKEKLRAVLEARSYAESIGLTPKHSFTKYSRVDGDVLVWVLVGSRPDSFALKQWWFPFVGSVPYKGFFEKRDAESAAKRLELLGYETWVRGSEAMSTLGWFNDPVLSTTLRHDELQIVNTVIHEILHSTIWIKGHVDFNESLANFVGHQGALEYYRNKLSLCAVIDHSCREIYAKKASAAAADLARELELGAVIEALYSDLDALYSGPAAREEKIARRGEVFLKHLTPLRAKYPQMKILTAINNAEIIQLKLYLTSLGSFVSLYDRVGKQWTPFFSAIRSVAKRVAEEDADPFWLIAQEK